MTNPNALQPAVDARRAHRETATREATWRLADAEEAKATLTFAEADERAGLEGDRAAVIAEARARCEQADADLRALLASVGT